MRTLIVEDEPLVALLLEDMLAELGHRNVHVAYDLATARNETALLAFDLAILDVNLGCDLVFPFAAELRARSVPILFTTASSRLPAEWSDCPRLFKPVDENVLGAALSKMGFSATMPEGDSASGRSRAPQAHDPRAPAE